MSAPLDWQKLGLIFQSRQDIIDGIKRAADSPGRVALFNEIASHVHTQLQGLDEPALKRRKVDPSQSNAANGGASASGSNVESEPILLQIKEISVSIPQRKKFELCLTQNYLYARAPGTTAPVPGIVYSWKDIEYIFYLPVPEKAQLQYNYVLLPRGTALPSKTNPPTTEPLVFTVPGTSPKEGTIAAAEASAAAAVSDTYRSLFHWALGKRLQAAGNQLSIVSADPNKFHSVVRQPQRPSEKAVHVGGYRGSKDGYLFFLENGILWGFKKPLVFLPLKRIAAISYTSILQITFNMVVEVFGSDEEPNEEFEFGMLDQQNYGGIDNYVKVNGLQDRSMAEQRKAKLQLAENRVPKKTGDEEDQNGDAPGGDKTVLEQAQYDAEQQLQDDEDDEEEDYDPDAEDDSDASGSDGEREEAGEEAAVGEEGEEEYDEDEEGEEEYDEEAEEEEEEEEEEDDEEQPSQPAPPVKAEPVPVAQMPVRQSVAETSHADDDADEEKFDVI